MAKNRKTWNHLLIQHVCQKQESFPGSDLHAFENADVGIHENDDREYSFESVKQIH